MNISLDQEVKVVASAGAMDQIEAFRVDDAAIWLILPGRTISELYLLDRQRPQLLGRIDGEARIWDGRPQGCIDVVVMFMARETGGFSRHGIGVCGVMDRYVMFWDGQIKGGRGLI
jgi:hypothetical protein